MKRSTRINSLMAATFAGLISTPALSAEATIRTFDVDVTLAAMDGANALSYYPELEVDLEKAIDSFVALDRDPMGYVVSVSLDRMTLDGDMSLPDSMEFNQMEGVVLITNPTTNDAPLSFPISLNAESAEALVREDAIAKDPDMDDFYHAMVIGFAWEVAETMPDTMRNAASR